MTNIKAEMLRSFRPGKKCYKVGKMRRLHMKKKSIIKQ